MLVLFSETILRRQCNVKYVWNIRKYVLIKFLFLCEKMCIWKVQIQCVCVCVSRQQIYRFVIQLFTFMIINLDCCIGHTAAQVYSWAWVSCSHCSMYNCWSSWFNWLQITGFECLSHDNQPGTYRLYINFCSLKILSSLVSNLLIFLTTRRCCKLRRIGIECIYCYYINFHVHSHRKVHQHIRIRHCNSLLATYNSDSNTPVLKELISKTYSRGTPFNSLPA